jgi:hypothetical protein
MGLSLDQIGKMSAIGSIAMMTAMYLIIKEGVSSPPLAAHLLKTIFAAAAGV